MKQGHFQLLIRIKGLANIGIDCFVYATRDEQIVTCQSKTQWWADQDKGLLFLNF